MFCNVYFVIFIHFCLERMSYVALLCIFGEGLESFAMISAIAALSTRWTTIVSFNVDADDILSWLLAIEFDIIDSTLCRKEVNSN